MEHSNHPLSTLSTQLRTRQHRNMLQDLESLEQAEAQGQGRVPLLSSGSFRVSRPNMLGTVFVAT